MRLWIDGEKYMCTISRLPGKSDSLISAELSNLTADVNVDPGFDLLGGRRGSNLSRRLSHVYATP